MLISCSTQSFFFNCSITVVCIFSPPLHPTPGKRTSLLSHFECNSHTVHMFTQHRLLPPLTSTVKSSLFMHVHSNPLSLTSMLYRCHTNRSCYINNGWTFSGQILYSYSFSINDWTLQTIFKKYFIYLFLERGKGREKNIGNCLMYSPRPGTEPATQ